jgi:sugar phosphate isomerase/epimerase
MPHPRTLLRLFPAASGLLAMASRRAPVTIGSQDGSLPFTIAVHAWSWRRFSLYEAIRLTALSGAPAIELFPGQKLGGPHGGRKLDPFQPGTLADSIRRECATWQVAPVALGVIAIPQCPAQARPLFDFAQALGLKRLTTESIDALDTIETLAVEYDLEVAFHHHPKPTRLWHPQPTARALEDRDPRLGFCIDPGHWVTSELDPLDSLRPILSRVRSMHAKDRAQAVGWSHDRALGTGVLPYRPMLRELVDHGFKGHVAIEIEHNWDTNLGEIAQSVGYLRAVATG